jgi:hypothetical protein
MSTNERLTSIAISVAVAGFIYFLAGGRNSHPFIKAVVLIRFSALMAILQFAAALAGLGAFSSLESLLQNVFILDNGWQLCHVTWMSLLLGTAILVTWRTTKINAPYRFTDLKEAIDRYAADEDGAAAIGRAGQSPLGRLRNQFLSIATAARLSATFPYVSPIARPSAPVKEPFHLADGGYVDNEGMVSALEWLRHLVALRGSVPAGTSFDRVLLVRIVPFPPEAQEATFSRLGWLQMFSGPIDAMMNVRSTSQVERNQIALQLTEDVLKARQGQPELRVAQFQFRNPPDDKKGPPLSWRLSLTQKAAVKSAWRAVVAGSKDTDNPLHVIRDWFVVKP